MTENRITQSSRITGCLLAGAAGDALGYPVEFLRWEDIMEEYGPWGIRGYTLGPGGTAVISDDTQMTMFTACGLLYGMTQNTIHHTEVPMWRYILSAYQDWLRTQGGAKTEQEVVSWIYTMRRLHAFRAPGNTCMSGLEIRKNQMEMNPLEDPINGSKGCGGIMRIAPIALYGARHQNWSQREVIRLCCEAAAITHSHPLGFLPAGALGGILYDLMMGQSLEASCDSVINCLRQDYSSYDETKELIQGMERSIHMAQDRKNSDLKNLAALGEGWVAEETLYIALYCAFRHPDDIKKALILSVNHDGDSDSTGEVTGQILGALLGAEAIPEDLLENLELADILHDLAEDLDHGMEFILEHTCQDAEWERRYILPHMYEFL